MSNVRINFPANEPERIQHCLDWSRRVKFWLAVHYLAGYLSVSGLGFLFACLIVGATEYLLPLAIYMVVCAVVSVASNPIKSGGYYVERDKIEGL
jgi:hypothetical protein